MGKPKKSVETTVGINTITPIFVPNYTGEALYSLGRKVKNKAVNYIRQKLYDRVDPNSYNIKDAISQFLYKGRNTQKDDIYDALWAKYLNRTNKQAGYDVESYFQPATYTLTKGKPVGKLYKLTQKAWKGNDDANPLGDSQLYEMLKSGKTSDFGDGIGSTMTGLGTYTRSLGQDEKGKYMSYYDEWDISPIGNKQGKEGKDQTMGIGTPFSIYDRRYYTDEEADSIIKARDEYNEIYKEWAKNQSKSLKEVEQDYKKRKRSLEAGGK